MARTKSLTPKQADRQHRILSAARDLVADHGYDGMVMSEVAERAGVSPTTLYNLYNTKDELVLEALRDLMIDNTSKVMLSSSGPGRDHLLLYFRNGPKMAEAAPAYAKAIIRAFLRANFGDALIEMLLITPRQDIRTSLIAMKQGGELKPGIDVPQLATALIGVYWSSFILQDKGLVKHQDLGLITEMNVLSLLVASTQGASQKILQQELNKAILAGESRSSG